MKLSKPSAPSEQLNIHGESITIDVDASNIIIPTGKKYLSPLFNEYLGNPNKLTKDDFSFRGCEDVQDYAVGSVHVTTGDGVYLTDVANNNISKDLSTGKLSKLGYLTIDNNAHTITDEFTIVNRSLSNNELVISNCATTTGWAQSSGTVSSINLYKKRLQIIGTSDYTGKLTVSLPVSSNLNAYVFFGVSIGSTRGGSGYVRLSSGADTSNSKTWQSVLTNTANTRYILPLNAPLGTSGVLPSAVSGTLDLSNITLITVGVVIAANTACTIYIDNITADVGRSAFVEIRTPDNLADTSLQIQTYDGTSYNTAGTYKLNSSYSSVSQSSVGWTLLDGTKLDDVYGSGAGRAVFPKGIYESTVTGSVGTATYSSDKGTKHRLGLIITLPPSDDGRTNFNKIRFRLSIFYTDIQNLRIPDLSGNSHDGICTSDSIQENYGITLTGGTISCNNFSHGNLLTFDVHLKTTRNNTAELIGGQGQYQNTGWYLWAYNGKLRCSLNSATIAENIDTTGTVYSANEEFSVKIIINSSTKSISFYKNGSHIETKSYSVDWVKSTTHKFIVGKSSSNTYPFIGTIYSVILNDETGLLLSWKSSAINMGSTTYIFEDSFNQIYGLQQIKYPWIALQNSNSDDIDVFRWSHRIKRFEYKCNASGRIYELILYPGNGVIYHSRTTNGNQVIDSNTDLIPDFLSMSITSVLSPFGIVDDINSNPTLTTYVVPAISDDKILPSSDIPEYYISDTITSKISIGEYKSLSFVVNSDQRISNFKITVSDLTDGSNILSAENIDIRSVKCWYTGGKDAADTRGDGKYLSPELLLHDDSLVHVLGDTWNYWDITNPSGVNYVKLTSGIYKDTSTTWPGSLYIIPISQLPIQDADTLQPLDLPENYNKQFWITVNAPTGTVSGNYRGVITLSDDSQVLKTIDLNITVLSLVLPSSSLEFCMYYRGYITENGSISSEEKTVQQFTADMQNLLKHGVTNPTVYNFSTDAQLTQILSIRQQLGMDNTNLYHVVPAGGSSDATYISSKKTLAAQYGVVNWYEYMPDETDLNTTTYRNTMATGHTNGAKYFCAQTSGLQATPVADILDLAIVGSALDSTIPITYHNPTGKYDSVAHRVFSYANPHTQAELPRIFRLNYGLKLWQYDYDGAMNYVYQSLGTIWNDFANGVGSERNQVLAYPTINGVIDTLQWEGCMEGTNDIRYLTALKTAINSGTETDATVIEANTFLTTLKSQDITYEDLDTIRDRIIDYIIAIQNSSHHLTVTNGLGSGFYANNKNATISAYTQPTGLQFNNWIGDTSYVSNANLSSTSVVMPSTPINVTATYAITSGYWMTGYSGVKILLIDHTKVSNTNQVNFPVFISITDPNLASTSNGGLVETGYDIIFSMPDKTILDYEIVSYNDIAGSLNVWIKIPELSVSQDTFICLYYGNVSVLTSQQNKTAIWDSNHAGVWHLTESGTSIVGNYTDSTVNVNNSLNTTNQPTATTGLIVQAQSFDGVNDYVDFGNGNSLRLATGDFTVSILIYPTNTNSCVYIRKGTYNVGGWYIWLRPSGVIRVQINNSLHSELLDSSNYTYTLNAWNLIDIVMKSGTISYYVNGILKGTSKVTISITEDTSNLILGKYNDSYAFTGKSAELHISNIARSPEWIKTRANNLLLNSVFVKTG